jgi:putative endopeptidase
MRHRIVLAALAFAAVSTFSLAQVAGRAQLGSWGVDLTSMDKSVKPGDNFFEYTSGNWIKTASISPERSNAGSFLDLRIQSERRMKDIMAELAAKPVAQLSPEERKLHDLYVAYTDTAAIEKNGLAPVQKDLDRLAKVSDLEGVARAMGAIPLTINSVFNFGIDINAKDSNLYEIRIMAGGLGMPDRDYYLRDDKEIVETRNAYRAYLTKMLQLSGQPERAEERAAALLALETRIAEAHWTRADKRDEDKTYNPITMTELKALAPEFKWDAFFDEAGISQKTAQGKERVVIAMENTAFPKLAKIFAETPIPVWRDYLRVQYLHAVSDLLPKRFDDADFAFYGEALGGRAAQLDRTTRGVQEADSLMGEALGKLYVAKYFPPEAKAKAQALVSNLLKACEGSIQSLDWMSPETKTKALAKLAAFTPKIGYPDVWRDYSALQISANDPVANHQRATIFDWKRQIDRIDRPTDKKEWGMTPPTVNAYYMASFNEIVFPAAILQPPFFDPNADDAVNYGGIGAVIGHEISHGFDDQGSKYDGQGRLQNWWTAADRANFDARTKALTDQFNSYEVLPGLKVIGANTLGENIADLSGLEIALKAYHISLNGRPAPVIDGYTGDQRFFLGYGQIWRSKYRENALRTQVMSDPHSPAQFRVIGSTRNMDAWYASFGVQPGDKYYLPPAQRVKLW